MSSQGQIEWFKVELGSSLVERASRTFRNFSLPIVLACTQMCSAGGLSGYFHTEESTRFMWCFLGIFHGNYWAWRPFSWRELKQLVNCSGSRELSLYLSSFISKKFLIFEHKMFEIIWSFFQDITFYTPRYWSESKESQTSVRLADWNESRNFQFCRF